MFAMMVLVDYFNTATRGRFSSWFRGGRFRQYIIAGMLGFIPGCLGSFMMASIYLHGFSSMGAIVANMIATSGDEAFVMLITFPKKAVFIFLGLFALGLIVAPLVDFFTKKAGVKCLECDVELIHIHEESPALARPLIRPLSGGSIIRISMIVGLLVLSGIGFIPTLLRGFEIVEDLIFTIPVLFILVIILISSRHYIKEHIIKHILKEHIWKILLWTIGGLIVVMFLSNWGGWEEAFAEWGALILLASALVGVMPESGPHLVFVFAYSQGLIPLSVLITSSIVQDGHGMLPIFAHSVKEGLKIKTIMLVIGLLVGYGMYLGGF